MRAVNFESRHFRKINAYANENIFRDWVMDQGVLLLPCLPAQFLALLTDSVYPVNTGFQYDIRPLPEKRPIKNFDKLSLARVGE